MKHLLEAINRGILKGLNESTIELLADLDDENLDQQDSLQTKSINNRCNVITRQLQFAIRSGNISNELKQLINDPANFDKFKGIIKANDKDHLLELITIGQKLFGDDGNFNWIDTSEITDMSSLFFKNKMFNGHIELWDVSNVEYMYRMFCYAYKFNQPIGDWNVSNVTDMRSMFCCAYKFNQPIGDWNVSNVTDMSEMFYYADGFNQPIGDWNVNNVEDMSFMFCSADSFNQPLNNWVIRDGVNIKYVFDNCPIKEEYKPNFNNI